MPALTALDSSSTSPSLFPPLAMPTHWGEHAEGNAWRGALHPYLPIFIDHSSVVARMFIPTTTSNVQGFYEGNSFKESTRFDFDSIVRMKPKASHPVELSSFPVRKAKPRVIDP